MNKKIITLLTLCILLIIGGIVLYLYFFRGEEKGINDAVNFDDKVSTPAPFFLTTMTHMESGFTDDTDEAVFDRHLEELRYAMDLADAYDAKLTIESEEPFAIANEKWGTNIMAEILERGHGVGTHCDIPPTPEMKGPKNVQELAAEMKERKELVDALVGAENNYGCSGAGGMQDWVLGATQAGFHYVDGFVGYHYLSMPLSARPEDWIDAYILESAFHFNVPYELEDRIYPRLLANALDFEEDKNGTVLASTGDMGRLAGIAEGAAYCHTNESCVLAKDDVDRLVEWLRFIDSWRDTNRVAKINMYFSANDFVKDNEEVFTYFFSEMQKLQDEGVITWATQREVYDAFMERQ